MVINCHVVINKIPPVGEKKMTQYMALKGGNMADKGVNDKNNKYKDIARQMDSVFYRSLLRPLDTFIRKLLVLLGELQMGLLR